MPTAISRIAALNSSWPAPSNSAPSSPAKAATTQAPARPPSTPPATHRLRRGTPRRGQHDADDQPGLDDLAEDDESVASIGYSATITPLAVSS